MIRRLLKNAMSEPDRTALLCKARLMCDARHHANNFAVTPFVRTRGEKRQKRIAATPFLFQNRVASGDSLPTVDFITLAKHSARSLSTTRPGHTMWMPRLYTVSVSEICFERYNLVHMTANSKCPLGSRLCMTSPSPTNGVELRKADRS